MDGNWGIWNNLTDCNKTCAGGYYERERSCDNPPPVGQGELCIDLDGTPSLKEVKSFLCNNHSCPSK